MKTLEQLEQRYEKAKENADEKLKKAAQIKKQRDNHRCGLVQKKLNQLKLSTEDFNKFISFLSLEKDRVLEAIEVALDSNNHDKKPSQ